MSRGGWLFPPPGSTPTAARSFSRCRLRRDGGLDRRGPRRAVSRRAGLARSRRCNRDGPQSPRPATIGLLWVPADGMHRAVEALKAAGLAGVKRRTTDLAANLRPGKRCRPSAESGRCCRPVCRSGRPRGHCVASPSAVDSSFPREYANCSTWNSGWCASEAGTPASPNLRFEIATARRPNAGPGGGRADALREETAPPREESLQRAVEAVSRDCNETPAAAIFSRAARSRRSLAARSAA